MRNVIGRENLLTCGRTNELTHTVRTEYSCNNFMADRMGLDGTMLAVQKSYGERTQTRTFENNANLLTYLAS